MQGIQFAAKEPKHCVGVYFIVFFAFPNFPDGITGNGLKICAVHGENVPLQSHSHVDQLSVCDLIAP
jgi:hypothetical protein